jgi:hypothetical protein
MALFKKIKQEPVGKIQIEQLHTAPFEQLVTLQKRVDHLQAGDIQLSTHVGELALNANGEIRRIELLMLRIKEDMMDVKERLMHLSDNTGLFINTIGLTARADEVDRFKADMDRIHLFDYITVHQFEKMVKDALNNI